MIDCANCGTPNESGRKFCRQCGERLGITCPACGAVETGDARFCGECGTSLGGPAGAAVGEAIATRTAPAPATERRLVSVLFADLVGFTTIAESRDPEEVRELLTEYYEIAREIVGRYRGSIDKFIGDAVMAVWGAPTAREDDAERAVRCALDLVASVPPLGLKRGIPELSLRAGVHTGEAAVSMGAEGQGLVAGDIVNTASRLQSVAPAGGVVVGESTERAASRSIAFQRLPEQALKGKSVPVAAWAATHIVAAGGGAGRSERLEPPFVGRTAELQLLKDLYHATVREGRTRLVSVIGQAGIGKTRLAWELEKYATGLADESRWFQGRSPAYDEGLSYWALGEMVRRAAGIAEADDSETTRQKLAGFLDREIESEADRRWLEPRLGALLGTDPVPEGERADLFAAWRTLFEQAAARSPVVLVFEDLHWADAGMLDFIESLLEWSRRFPILIVTLARRELIERRPTWGAGQRSFTSLYLEPLPETDMRALLDGLVPGLPAPIIEQVLAQAEGVPLYAVETVRMLLDRGDLQAEDGGYRLVRDPERLALPETLHALIAARLDGLPPAERRLLQDASVLGLTFTPPALAGVAGVREAELRPVVDSLVAKELLRVDADPRSPERGQLGFVQGAIREVAYSGLGRAERRSRHLDAARFLAGTDDDEIVGIVASHFLAAYDAAPDHVEAAELRDQARTFLLAAADRAQRLHSYRQALAYLEQALLITDAPADAAALHERAGGVARVLEDPDTAERHLTEAIEWHRQKGDADAAGRATAALSTALIDNVRTEQAIALIEQAMHEFGLHERPTAVPLMANLARAHFIRGEWHSSVEWADRAIVAGERVDDVPSILEALINRAGAVAGLGRLREAQVIWRGAVALAERHGATVSAMRATSNLASLESEDSPRTAVAALTSGLELAQRAGEVGYASGFRFELLMLRLQLGEWDAVLDEVRSMDEQLLMPHEWEHFNDELAVVAAFRGEVEHAAELLARWKQDPQKTVSQHEAAHHWAMGLVDFARGEHEDAHRHGATAATSEPMHHEGQFLAGRAALWLRDGARLESAIIEFESEGVHTQLRKAQQATLRAGLAGLSGEDTDDAYDAVVARWRELEHPLQIGIALLEQAAFGSPAAAEHAAAAARVVLASIGAEGLVDRLRNRVATET